VLLVALALALAWPPAVAALAVGLATLVVGGVAAFIGLRRLPREPLPKTQERLRSDLSLTREQFA
jgi:hypothetical protein